MSCKVKIINSCEIYGNKFVDRVLNFTDRDLTNDSFSAKVISMNGAVAEIQGIKVANKVLFPVESIQNLRIGNYKIEYWADFSEFGKQLFAIENFQVTNKPCNCDDDSDGVFVIEFKEVTIEVQLFKGIVNIGNLTDEERRKLADLENYDDTEVKEDIANINEILPQKVDKIEGFGLSKNNFSDAYKTKVENLQNFDPTYINNALGNKVDKVANKGLSTNDYTTAEKNKLAGLDGNKFFGKFADETALSAVVGIIGGYAYVGGVGRNDESYIWDDDDLKWVKSNNIPTAETPASVKTKYESNPDTNAFTNVRRDKLNNAVVASDLPTANVGSATKLQTARTITVGSSGKTFDGSANITVTLAEIGAQAVADMVNYLPYTGAIKDINLNKQKIISIGSINHDAAGREVANVGRFKDLLLMDGIADFVSQSDWWNGTAFVTARAHHIGIYAGQFSRGTANLSIGDNSNRYNVASNVYSIGSYSGRINLSNYVVNIGTNSGNSVSSGGHLNNLGLNSGFQMAGVNGVNNFGYNTSYYYQGTNSNVIGYNSNSSFKDNASGNKIFDSSAIDLVAKTIAIPNHGFGSANAYTNLKFTQGTSAITGISNGNIIQVKIIDNNTLLFSELLPTNQYRHTHNITNAGTGTGHIFTPQFIYHTLNIFGANLEPTKSNQNIISGGEFLMPSSTIATLDADTTKKTLVTAEWVFAKIGTQIKVSANTTLNSTHDRQTIIATANVIITVPLLPNNFECTIIADGGAVTFAGTSGALFKFNGGKVTLLSGGTATLIKENGTNNFYLKGDLT